MQRRDHVWLALVATLWAFNLGSLCIVDTHKPTLEFRMNYGMFFRPLKHASIKTDVWRQVFVVEIPDINVGNLARDVPTSASLRHQMAVITMIPMLRSHVPLCVLLITENDRCWCN